MASPVDRPALWHPPHHHDSEEDSEDPITCDEWLQVPIPRVRRSPLPVWAAGIALLVVLSALLWLV